MKSIIIFIMWFFYCAESNATILNNFGIGFSTGYRLNNSSIYSEYNASRLLVSFEYLQNKYQGIGYSPGVNFRIPFSRFPFEFDAGLYYCRFSGGPIAFEWNYQANTKHTEFDVTEANYLIPAIAVRYNLRGYDSSGSQIRVFRLSAFIRLGFRIVTEAHPGVSFIKGDDYPEQQKKIENSIKQGLGFSVGFAYIFNNKIRRSGVQKK